MNLRHFGLNETLSSESFTCTVMDRRRLLLVVALLFFIVSLTVVTYYYVQLQSMVKPSWLMLGAYVTYEQVIVWDDNIQTEYMTWNLTGLSGDYAFLHLISHGIDMSGGNVVVVTGEADWKINMFTREIVDSSDVNYVGKKCPFWIQTNVRIGSAVDILYGVATIGKSESVDVLGQHRDCWVLEYSWPTSSMKRWFDKSSGICLKINVTMHEESTTITTTETVVLTDIGLQT